MISVFTVVFCCVLFAGCCACSGTDAPYDTNQSSDYAQSETVGLNESIIIGSFYNGPGLRISVDEVIRGSRADSVIAECSMGNPDPYYGYEYLLVNLRVENSGGTTRGLNPRTCLPVYASGAGYNPEWIVFGDLEKFDSDGIPANGEKTGWIAYMVPIGEDAKLAYKPSLTQDPRHFILLG